LRNDDIEVSLLLLYQEGGVCAYRAGVDWAVEYLLGLVKEEEKKENIEPSRVMLGGFSQVFFIIIIIIYVKEGFLDFLLCTVFNTTASSAAPSDSTVSEDRRSNH
jgi:hypothetical protein